MSEAPIEFTKILGKIQKLLALADHPNTNPAEASTFREKAEALMVEYRIEEQHLRDTGVIVGMQLVKLEWIVSYSHSKFLTTYQTLAYLAASHVGARYSMRWGRDEDGRSCLMFDVVGFESDVRYAELIFTAAKLVFQARMEPKLDPSLSDEVNAYNMRASGMTRRQVAALMNRDTHAGHAWVNNAYQAECARRGERAEVAGKGFNLDAYRDSYSQGFKRTFQHRLYDSSRNSAEAGALVLKSRNAEVDEAFYQLFPDQRPSKMPVKWEPEIDDRTEAQKKRDQARWDRETEKAWLRSISPAGQAGSRAGKDAAASVDFGGVGPKGRL